MKSNANDDRRRHVDLALRLRPLVCLVVVLLLNSGFVTRPARAVDEFDPRVQASVEKAVNYLYANILTGDEGRDSIAAYALMKAGESEENAPIAEVIQRIRSRASGGTYNPKFNQQRYEIYIAAVDLLTLAEANPEKYQAEIRGIIAFIRSRQAEYGAYAYPPGTESVDAGGDTSITQYAALALWGATQSGVDVDPEIFDRISAWCINTQSSGGGFAYHPSDNQGATPLHSMTVGGLQTLLIARMHLYPTGGNPDDDADAEKTDKKSDQPAKTAADKFKVLEKVDLDEEANDIARRAGKRHFKAHAPKKHNYKPKVTIAQFQAAIDAGQHWMDEQYTATNPTGWKWYYFYGLERYTALAGVETIGGHDWYSEGIAEVMKNQQDDGSWGVTHSASNKLAETAFCILFLTKATARIFKPIKNPTMIGTGLLVGGRGLPDNLDRLEMKNGKAGAKKKLGEIDDLLKALENPQLADVESTQTDLVEAVQLGDRNLLIQQKNRLLKLVEHPDAEIRRTAIWALGRTGDIRMAQPILQTMQENNVDVLVESNNALCWLSRRPLGVGLPDSPYDEIEEGATEVEKQEAFEAWRRQLQERWQNWYQAAQPYDERDTVVNPSNTSKRTSR
ncbi:MAG: hypothetical protein O2955_05440 [Planctomycetota bacterium]|nr:hypothetical protein [Planctomycetota bacterium]MDA1211936.1 hypothetical protein [Planctomycetota bacterium]